MRFIENKFDLGQEVYLKTDREQVKRLVIGICLRPNGIIYELACGPATSWHYDLEMAEQVDVLATSTN
jgi:hypothetical protein